MHYKVENWHAVSQEQSFFAHSFKISVPESLSLLNYENT